MSRLTRRTNFCRVGARSARGIGDHRGDRTSRDHLRLGHNAATVTELGQLERLFREHQQAPATTLWDVHIDDLIPSRNFRRVHYGEA